MLSIAGKKIDNQTIAAEAVMNFTRGCSNTLTILIKKNDSTTFLHYFFTQVLLINYVKCIQKQTNKNIT